MVEASKKYTGSDGAEYYRVHQSDKHSLIYKYKADCFIPYLSPTDRVLDFGCGNGGMLPYFENFCSCIEGLEINEHARKVASDTSFKIYKSLDEIPREAAFDVILSSHCLEHVVSPCEALRELLMRLKTNGKLLVLLPIDEISSPLQRSWSLQDKDHHLFTWTPRLFANLLVEAGFSPIDVKMVAKCWHPKLFFLRRFGLDGIFFWLISHILRRRQLFAVAIKP